MKLNPTTKILLAAVLLILAVASWYMLYLQGTSANAPELTPEPAPEEQARTATSTSARALEILPLPFLVTEAPVEPPAPPPTPPAESGKPLHVATTKPPPNPFAPLPQRLRAERAAEEPEGPTATPTEKQPVVVTAPKEPELIQVPTPQIQPPPIGEPILPPEAKLGTGALPIRIEPLEREVVAETSTPSDGESQGKAKTSLNPLKEWAKAQGLRLAGIALGPVSVAIFVTKDGYYTLPVGERFPGTDIQLKAVTAERVLLVQGSYTLTLEYGGGE